MKLMRIKDRAKALISRPKNEKTVTTELERSSLELLENIEKTQSELKEHYGEMALLEEPEAYDEQVKQTYASYRRGGNNILRSYTRIIEISDEFGARWDDILKSKRRKLLLPPTPSNSLIDVEEDQGESFARGLNAYKLLLICYIGSFLGVIIELAWCLLNRGYLEGRAGLVYGPFNLLYGAGAVALTVTLYSFRNRGKWLSFLGGMLVGSVVEYVCSWAQEAAFGSRSWDYSHMPFNLNGRICLLYSVFWGLLGVLWVKNIYPRMAKYILRIPNRFGRALTIALTVFFVINAIVSIIALYRWSQRVGGIEPSNAFWSFIDSRFTNERMSKIYANMVFN